MRLAMTTECEFGLVDVERILDLRHRVLRQGLPASSARFDGDLDEGTRHYAAFDDERVVCCLTLLPSTWGDAPAWQLRGMATEPEFQGTGIGSALVRYATADALALHPDWVFWCNARRVAVGFYARHGWVSASEEFDIPTAGPHRRMAWTDLRTRPA
jgi:predicted GNAT family N-acyltransferase